MSAALLPEVAALIAAADRMLATVDDGDDPREPDMDCGGYTIDPVSARDALAGALDRVRPHPPSAEGPAPSAEGLTVGDFAIIDECDAPCARRVVMLTGYDARRGVWTARYLHKEGNIADPCGARPTPLSAFGMRVEQQGAAFRVVATGAPATATYADGAPRRWQDRQVGVWLPGAGFRVKNDAGEIIA